KTRASCSKGKTRVDASSTVHTNQHPRCSRIYIWHGARTLCCSPKLEIRASSYF
ncbi:unnamed protein product, partial [Ixodes pacificus]